MANTLSEFVSHIKKSSIARTNRFRINFSFPNLLNTNGLGQDIAKVISLTCLMADVPGRQEQSTVVAYGNYGRKVVFTRSTNDFNTTFLLTGKHYERKLFDAWHNLICDETTNSVHYYDDYVATILVECLNEQDVVQYSFELSEAYPSAISSGRLDRTAQNQQMVMDVNWAYHKITFLPEARPASTTTAATAVPPVGVPGPGSAKNRLLAIPAIGSFSSAVQSAVATVKEFRGQLQGVLDIAKDVREQVRDAKMAVLDGVKTLNGVVKDVKAIAAIPNDVKAEVVAFVNDTKNSLGSLKNDVKNFSKYPKK